VTVCILESYWVGAHAARVVHRTVWSQHTLQIVRSQHAPLLLARWARKAARLNVFVSGAYNSHSSLNFQIASFSFGWFNSRQCSSGTQQFIGPPTVIFLCPCRHPLPSRYDVLAKRAKTSMAFMTAQPPSGTPWSRASSCSAYYLLK